MWEAEGYGRGACHKLEPIREVRCKEPKREGVVCDVILDRKDNKAIIENMNGGFRV